MPRKRNSIPSYLPHTQTGRARAVWTDQAGGRRFQILPGDYDSPESRAAFTALLLEQQAAPHRVATPERGGTVMAELLLGYLKHAEHHYRGPGGNLARRHDESHSDWWERLTGEEQNAVKAWRKTHHWHPNQLRHSFATRVRKQYGLEAAQVLLGHTRADVTQVYVERNEELAAKVAAKIG